MVVELKAIDGVLPDDVAAWAYCCERIDIGARHPDGESGVFLSERLSALHCAAEEASNIAPNRKLHHAYHKAHHGYGGEQREWCVRIHDVAECDARDD